jgi:small-conductance mechanosensitive channel
MPDVIIDVTRLVGRLWRQAEWLPQWAVVVLVLTAFVGLGFITHVLIFGMLRRIVRRRDVFWRGVVERARTKLRVLMLIAATAIGVTVSPLDPDASASIRSALLFLAILTAGWLAAGVMDMWTAVYMRRFNTKVEDNLLARKHVTQARILQKVAKVVIAVIALGLALMTFAGFRQWGVSLLASAGVVGIIAGFALQPVLTNLLAGIQIAMTQPIRLDDAVIVEGEAGTVEEITSTYVVVRLWDWRRMVLPLSYFIQKPFQNWTRETSRLIGTAFLHVDYEAPVDRLRAELERICRDSPLWDGEVVSLQVTDVTDRTVQLRCLASARNSGQTFDLQAEIREKMLAFMRDHCREALPRERVELGRLNPPPEAPRDRP